MAKEKKWVCKRCGKSDVELKLWINPNTGENIIKQLTNPDDEDTYCHNCVSGGWGIEFKEIEK